MSIAGSMVGSERCHDDWSCTDHSVHRPWTLNDFAETDQRNLGRINHPEHGLDALFAKILPYTLRRDGELPPAFSSTVASAGKIFSNPQLVNSVTGP